MSNATPNRTGGGGFAHYTIKTPLEGGGMDTSPEPYAIGVGKVNSSPVPTGEACTAPHLKGRPIMDGKKAEDNMGRYDNRNSIDPYANESRRMP